MANDLDKIIRALEDDRWEWRTLGGIAKDTKIPPERILALAEESPDMIVESIKSDERGERLFGSIRHLVIQALDNPRWDWRTISGIAQDTGLSERDIKRVIARNRNKILKSDVPSRDGEDLYTTVDHWEEIASAGDKIRGAFRNRRL